MKDLYHILGVGPSASAQDIKKAYFELAKKYHPDTGTTAQLKDFYAVTEAYQILSTPEKRKAYDATYKANRIEGALLKGVIHPSSTPFKTPIKSPRELKFRQSEIQRFRRELLLKASARVVVISFLGILFGYFYSLLFAGWLWLGALCGFLIGFGVSLYQNFNVNSFVANGVLRKKLHITRYTLIGLSVLYFVLILLI